MPGYAIRTPRSTALHALANGRILIRSGAVNRPLGGQEILRLASAKNTGDFETEAVSGVTTDDFSRALIDESLGKRAQRAKRAHSRRDQSAAGGDRHDDSRWQAHGLRPAALQRLHAALAAAEQRRFRALSRYDAAR